MPPDIDSGRGPWSDTIRYEAARKAVSHARALAKRDAEQTRVHERVQELSDLKAAHQVTVDDYEGQIETLKESREKYKRRAVRRKARLGGAASPASDANASATSSEE